MKKVVFCMLLLCVFFKRSILAEIPFLGITKWDSTGEKALIILDEHNILLINKNGEKILELNLEEKLNCAEILPNGGGVVFSTEEGIWKVENDGQKKDKLTADPAKNISISPDGQEIIYTVIENINKNKIRVVNYVLNIEKKEKREVSSKEIFLPIQER
ncbi:MAG: hypothetical protein DRI36_02950 [Caldiserica bacterium]|nr:MAG: hypothetical protein DRI36_02950 [Caldisericota bacterium]